MLRDDPARFSRSYQVLPRAARAAGTGSARLADFLGPEHRAERALLGQEELDIAALESAAAGRALRLQCDGTAAA
jgi:hypothetical protein